MRAHGLSSAVTALGVLLTNSVYARVEITIDYVDAANEGFFDPSPRQPLAANRGTTLGEQRRLAFERALAIWGLALESPVPIVVEATFAPFPDLPCTADAAVLGAARAEAAFAGFSGAPRADVFYPSPLADKLAGEDLDPGQPDISALFNPLLDDGECLGGIGWNYDFEPGEEQAEFVNTVLHELAHGLGFASLVDELSGDASQGVSIFETLMFDNLQGLRWDEMSAQERALSVSSPHALVWLGESVTRWAPDVLSSGKPMVVVEGTEAIRLVAEPAFGPFLGADSMSGQLVYLEPTTACEGGGSLDGAIVLLEAAPSCDDLITQLEVSSELGAIAALTRSELEGRPPWGIEATDGTITIPSLALSHADFDQLAELARDGAVAVTLRSDAGFIGTDEQGRVLLSATDPVQPGSSASHWDASARKRESLRSGSGNLLMEPAASGVLENTITDLSVQLLQDIGWGDEVCGNGLVESDEECDRGIANSDQQRDACREDCRSARCGDGVLDSGEECDDSSFECAPDCSVVAPGPSTPVSTDGGDVSPTPEPEDVIDAGPVDDEAGVSTDGGSLSRASSGGCGCRLVPLGETGGWAIGWSWSLAAGGFIRRRRPRLLA